MKLSSLFVSKINKSFFAYLGYLVGLTNEFNGSGLMEEVNEKRESLDDFIQMDYTSTSVFRTEAVEIECSEENSFRTKEE